MAIPKRAKNPFKKDWRERKIIHRTPGGKLTRVKISSLPADEQQKYNPNRFDKSDDLDPNALKRAEEEAGQVFNFYVQVKDEDELNDITEGSLLLATTDGKIVSSLFDNKDKIIMKLKNVPMDAVKTVALTPEDGNGINYSSRDNLEFENIDELEDNERYEKIKFNEEPIYQIDIASYLPYIDTKVDMPGSEDDADMNEGFYNFYYSK
jgi:hypothetical protein